MRTTAPFLRTRMALEESTLARIMAITCRDGTVVRLTDAQEDVVYGGHTYSASPGFIFNSVAFNADGAPSSVDITIGMADTGALSDTRIIPGYFDGATAAVFVVDYLYPALGAMQIGGVYQLGDIQYDNLRGAFSISVQSDTDALVEYAVRKIFPGCAWALGDVNCGVDILGGGWVKTATIDAVFGPRSYRINVTEPRDDERWYDHGAMKFTSGNNTGYARDIRIWTKASPPNRVFVWINFPSVPEVGDAFQIYPGCNLNIGLAGCLKFDNVKRYGGFPFVTEKGFSAPNEKVVRQVRDKGK